MKVITPRPMKVIAAYPCLGKTTISQANKDRCFDLELHESRATRYMYSNRQLLMNLKVRSLRLPSSESG